MEMISETARHPEFARKLRSARLKAKKSQERIAAEVGTSRRHWIRWERGTHLPSPEFLTRIGEATGQPDEFTEADADDSEAARAMTVDDFLRIRVREILAEERKQRDYA